MSAGFTSIVLTTLSIALGLLSAPALADRTVHPEKTVKVVLSNTDANRIVCTAGGVADVVTSEEKGVTVKIAGDNVYVKYRFKRGNAGLERVTTATEMFITCADEVYNLLIAPQEVPAQIVRLESGHQAVRENTRLFAGLPQEKRVLKLITQALKGEYPATYEQQHLHEPVGRLANVTVTLTRTLTVTGQGLRIKEFELAAPENIANPVTVLERDFLRPEIGARIRGLALSESILSAGQHAWLYVVEQVRP
ncbi:MAG TPA: type-F conjugative transfer system secretin TraK [Thiohalobacter sp.]|nr:type-F conjugative transfer system secretin TraK [Thiohalobacter sp.]